ncbi:MAG: IclR family transcriptional regulator [Ilumatobacteraceae bacterium]
MTSQPTNDIHRSNTSIKSVARAVALVQCFVDGDDTQSLTDLATRTQLSLSTAYRLLLTLCAGRILTRDPETGRYRLGPVLLAMAQRAFSGRGLREALVLVEDLAARTGESASLAIRDDDCAIVLLTATSSSPLRFDRPAGARVPLLASALGRALLAFAPAAGVVGRADTMPSMGPILDQVRAAGYALVDDEQFAGVRALAAPVFGTSRRLEAAVGIHGPISRVVDERLDRLATDVLGTAASIGALPTVVNLASE